MALTVDELRALFPTEASGGFELDTGRLGWRLAAARTTPISLRQSPPAVPLRR
ncbi:hypothetical protein [Streptomyces sp. NBC_00069]|uniref:hypothetical protein n=1 Tax=Streptomyces sp. NBC_00069 TaxID=2975639 RepID=UPI00324315ED